MKMIALSGKITATLNYLDANEMAIHASTLFARMKEGDREQATQEWLDTAKNWTLGYNPKGDKTAPKFLSVSILCSNQEQIDALVTFTKDLTRARGEFISPIQVPKEVNSLEEFENYCDNVLAQGLAEVRLLLDFSDIMRLLGRYKPAGELDAVNKAALLSVGSSIKVVFTMVDKDQVYTDRAGANKTTEKAHARSEIKLELGSEELQQMVAMQLNASMQQKATIGSIFGKKSIGEPSVEDKLYASVKWLPEVKEDARRKAIQDYIASGNDLSLFATAVDALCE